MTSTYEFVRHQDVAQRLAEGWTVASDLNGGAHGHWSVLMREPTRWRRFLAALGWRWKVVHENIR